MNVRVEAVKKEGSKVIEPSDITIKSDGEPIHNVTRMIISVTTKDVEIIRCDGEEADIVLDIHPGGIDVECAAQLSPNCIKRIRTCLNKFGYDVVKK